MERLERHLERFSLLLQFLFESAYGYVKSNPREVGAFSIALCMVIMLYYLFVSSPRTFPLGSIVTVPEGSTLAETSTLLKEERVIRSHLLFTALARVSLNEKNIFAGDYLLFERANVFTVINRLTRGLFGLSPVHVTIPEGVSVREIADLFAKQFPAFDKDTFILRADNAEGYLFPDTYFFLPNVREDKVYEALRTNFDRHIIDVLDDVKASGHSLKEIIIMASLLEEEARQFETKQIVSGILWKRLEIGMPLQVDATFLYINGKNTYELTTDDLATDSPYNTYKYRGLPEGPITNPGLESIRAALNPKKSEYLYYLSDRDGNMYYSETFDEHKEYKTLHVN